MSDVHTLLSSLVSSDVNSLEYVLVYQVPTLRCRCLSYLTFNYHYACCVCVHVCAYFTRLFSEFLHIFCLYHN